jgi:hypothetical protein
MRGGKETYDFSSSHPAFFPFSWVEKLRVSHEPRKNGNVGH